MALSPPQVISPWQVMTCGCGDGMPRQSPHIARLVRSITVKDFNGTREAQLSLVTTDIAEAIKDTQLILCPTPAFAQADIARLIAPHLVDGQVVYLPPATFGSHDLRQGRARQRQHGQCRLMPKPVRCPG